MALFAQGSAVIRDENGNFLLTTAGIGQPKSGDFFPLTVEYQEKYYASGKIGGNRFQKREGRPSEAAILNSRLIDRPIRPMFPKNTRTEVQIISTIMSSSGASDFGFFGITGASLSLMLAGVNDFEGPIAGVRIASDEAGNFIFDPTFEELEKSHLDLTVAGTAETITMVESQGHEVDNDLMIRALEFAHKIIVELCHTQSDFVAEYQKIYELPKVELSLAEENTELAEMTKNLVSREILDGFYGLGKTEFYDKYNETVANFANIIATRKLENLDENEQISLEEILEKIDENTIADALKDAIKTDMRARVLEQKIRLDGRTPNEVRPVRASVGLLPRTHGS